MARRKKESGVEVLFSMPWWVSGLFAGAAFFSPDILKLVLPTGQSQTGVSIQQALVTTAENFSPYLAAGLCMIALVVFAKETIANRKKSSAKDSYDWPAPESSPVNRQAEPHTHSRVSDILADRVWEEDRAVPVPTSWSLEVLQSLEWKRFEELCEAVFNELSLVARNTRFGADGGIDIELYDRNAPDTLVAIAQCKAWSQPVGVKHIREFYGVMVATRISKAYFVTTSSFTPDAITFSGLSEVTLISGKQLLRLIGSRGPETAERLLKLATSGDYTTPTCPGCGLKMVSRTASNSGNRFWGCRSFPRCKGKLNMRQAA